MGEFVFRLAETETGNTVARAALPNVLAYEGTEALLRQIFPTTQAALNLQLGIAAPLQWAPQMRPNPRSSSLYFGPGLTFANCTDTQANEGGGYNAALRTALGYARKAAVFTVTEEAGGGTFTTPEVSWSNPHVWTPQAAADWDLAWTVLAETPPPEWSPKSTWETAQGYPWMRPRKRSATNTEPLPGVREAPSYFHAYDATGALDYLADFRQLGAFPVGLSFLIDASRNKLIAAAKFRAPVALRPGLTLYLSYRARLYGQITTAFAQRFASFALAHAGTRYTAIYARPLLPTAPPFTRKQVYAELADHFDARLPELLLPVWTYVPYSVGPPVVLPRIQTTTVPTWTNESEDEIGPFGSIAIYGLAAARELMWVTPYGVSVPMAPDDQLTIPTQIRFGIDGI